MKSSYFIISVLAFICLFTFSAPAQTQDTFPVGLTFTVQGSTFPTFGNYMGGVGLTKYFTPDVAVRASVGGTFAEGSNAYVLSGTGLVDVMKTENTVAYLGAGALYTHPAVGETHTQMLIPLGARISIWPNTTVGVEYITTVDFSPTVVNVGNATAAGNLTFWF